MPRRDCCSHDHFVTPISHFPWYLPPSLRAFTLAASCEVNPKSVQTSGPLRWLKGIFKWNVISVLSFTGESLLSKCLTEGKKEMNGRRRQGSKQLSFTWKSEVRTPGKGFAISAPVHCHRFRERLFSSGALQDARWLSTDVKSKNKKKNTNKSPYHLKKDT